MVRDIGKEILFLMFVTCPIILLSIEWNEVPEIIALHLNTKGEPDTWGSKNNLIPFTLIPLGIYLVILLIPKLRQRTDQGNGRVIKLISLSLITITILVFLTSILRFDYQKINLNFLFVGSVVLVSSFFIKNLSPNMAIGIRVPWTLSNPEVWRDTHVFTGKAFSFTGFLIIILSLFFQSRIMMNLLPFMVIGTLLVSLFYSYSSYQKFTKK